jgi:HEAT repeat protein
MEALLQHLTSDDETDRVYAAQDIADSGDVAYVAPLLARWQHETSPIVRDAIAAALKRLDGTQSFPELFALFQSPDAYLRNQVVRIFAAQGEDAIGYLATQFDHADREVRKLILDTMYETGTPEAIMAIRAYLHDDAVNVRIAAVEYLGQCEDHESEEEMIALLQRDDEPMLRATILTALGFLGGSKAVAPVLTIIAPEGDVSRIESLYLPHVIRLIARVGSRDALIGLLHTAAIDLYAEEFVDTVDEARRRFPDLPRDAGIYARLTAIARNPDTPAPVRTNAAELLAALAGEGNGTPDELAALGMALTKEKAMLVPGVRLLAAVGQPDVTTIIRVIIDTIHDDEARLLCEDIISHEDVCREKP